MEQTAGNAQGQPAKRIADALTEYGAMWEAVSGGFEESRDAISAGFEKLEERIEDLNRVGEQEVASNLEDIGLRITGVRHEISSFKIPAYIAAFSLAFIAYKMF